MLKSTMIQVARSVGFGLGRLSAVHLIKYLILVLVLVISDGHLEVNAQQPGAVFRRLQACVDQANKKFPDTNSNAGKLVISIKDDSNVLLDKWMNATNQNVPREYLQTLTVNCELLDRATSSETDVDIATSLLQDVSKDLKVKATQAKNQVGASEALGASIQVSVKTRQNGKEIEGYLVRCNPKRYATQLPAMFSFNNPTNQAARILAPGNYIFWLETQGGQIVASRPITIGGNGESTEPTIWFDVP